MTKLKVTQTKSVIGGNQSQRETMRSLGLRKIGESVIREDDSQNRGMLRVVDHLVTIEEAD